MDDAKRSCGKPEAGKSGSGSVYGRANEPDFLYPRFWIVSGLPTIRPKGHGCDPHFYAQPSSQDAIEVF